MAPSFLEVASSFLEVAPSFLEVASRFLEVMNWCGVWGVGYEVWGVRLLRDGIEVGSWKCWEVVSKVIYKTNYLQVESPISCFTPKFPEGAEAI